MKTDLYTKIVLTVIAVALVAIFFRLSDANPISSVHAAAAPIPAPAPHERQVIDVNVVQWGGKELNPQNVSETEYMRAIAVKSY